MKLRNGQVLTEDLSEALAHEAEVGYDLATVRPRAVGRPSLGVGRSPRVQFRVDAATYEALLAKARAEDRGVGGLARLALEWYLRDEPGRTGASEPDPLQGAMTSTPRPQGIT